MVNKADWPGADRIARELERSVELQEGGGWAPPVHKVVASEGTGVDALLASVSRHLAWCVDGGRETWERRRGDARVRLALDFVAEAARAEARRRLEAESLLGALRDGRLSAHDAVRSLS